MESGKATYSGNPTHRSSASRMTTLALLSSVGALAGLASAGAPVVKASKSMNSGAVSSGSVSASNDAAKVELSDLRSGMLIVRTKDADALRASIDALAGQIPGVRIERQLDNAGRVFLVSTPNAGSAIRVHSALMTDSSIEGIQFDQPTLNPMRARLIQQGLQRRAALAAQAQADLGPVPVPGSGASGGSRGGSVDPLFGTQWHFQSVNVFHGFTHDNNIPSTIYTSDNLTGAGITVGVSDQGLNSHLDVDHTELDANFRQDLSMPFDPVLLTDNIAMTALAGIVAAEVDGVGVQGIAPAAEVATYRWAVVPDVTPLLEFNAFAWQTSQIDVKLFETATHYTFPFETYNPNGLSNYVLDSLQNSIVFGRGRKGVVNIFGAGPALAVTMPDPYTNPPTPTAADPFSPVDTWAAGNEISVGLTDGFTSGPFYPQAQLTYYPPANDRRALIINTAAEDRHHDIFSAQGPSMFASFYGGTTNQLASGSQAASGLGVLTAAPGASNFALFPTAAGPIFSEPMTGPAIAAGVVSLMLEVNPRLSIRDIQHIFFESIQDSTRDPAVKWPNFDSTRSYYFPNAPLVPRGFWQVNSGLYNSATTTNQAIRHSDHYGFGMVDAELAIEKARTWRGTAPLVLLDTGFVGEFGDDAIDNGEVAIEIPDAVYTVLSEADGTLGIDGAAVLQIDSAGFPVLCVRQNILIEAIELELTIEGGPSNDLYIQLVSPNGTRSILLLPTTANLTGTSSDLNFMDDDTDTGYAGVVFNDTNYSLYRHNFLTWKHWGELSGGEWSFSIVDYGPDEANPEGEPADPMSGDPGADMVISLGELGLPGSEFRENHVLTGYRFKIYGTDTGDPIFEGCNPFNTSCPADLNGDGIINVVDMQIFVNWYLTGDLKGDLDEDGDIDFTDLLLYRGIWRPGFCDRNDNPFAGGRPRPGSSQNNDNNPSTRPI